MKIHLDFYVLEHVELFHRLYFSLLRHVVMIPLTKENSNIEPGKCTPIYYLPESYTLD
jgi:hypothetical protein